MVRCVDAGLSKTAARQFNTSEDGQYVSVGGASEVFFSKHFLQRRPIQHRKRCVQATALVTCMTAYATAILRLPDGRACFGVSNSTEAVRQAFGSTD